MDGHEEIRIDKFNEGLLFFIWITRAMNDSHLFHQRRLTRFSPSSSECRSVIVFNTKRRDQLPRRSHFICHRWFFLSRRSSYSISRSIWGWSSYQCSTEAKRYSKQPIGRELVTLISLICRSLGSRWQEIQRSNRCSKWKSTLKIIFESLFRPLLYFSFDSRVQYSLFCLAFFLKSRFDWLNRKSLQGRDEEVF